jgi:hypothetical protein
MSKNSIVVQLQKFNSEPFMKNHFHFLIIVEYMECVASFFYSQLFCSCWVYVHSWQAGPSSVLITIAVHLIICKLCALFPYMLLFITSPYTSVKEQWVLTWEIESRYKCCHRTNFSVLLPFHIIISCWHSVIDWLTDWLLHHELYVTLLKVLPSTNK